MAMDAYKSWNPLVLSSRILLCFLFLFFFFTLYYPFHATALSFNLTDIGQYVNGEIIWQGDAYITHEGIQVTPNERGPDPVDKAGRAIYKDPLHLWDKASGKMTDFNTYFMFVIDSKGNSFFADGLTFFLVPYGSTPNMTIGGSLGLPNVAQSSNATNHFVAVEFDTFHNLEFDVLNETHVGIDINSLISNATEVWYNDITFGIENEAWISYNSRSKNFSIVLTGSRNNTRIDSVLSLQVDLSLYLPEWVTIGFSAATGTCFEKNTIKSWQFNSSLQISRKDNKKAPMVGLIVGSSVLICVLTLLGFVLWKKSSRAKEEDEFAIELSVDNDFEAGTGPKKFSYSKLLRATNKFNKEQKLGEGGFGEVYRGFLKESNSCIAVKRISKGSKQGTKEYTSEVKIISQLRHRNLVQLIGWCHEKRELLLVYDFMENGSLDYHLFKEKSLLTWAMRYKIAQGLASALLYLHEEWEQCVLHRDIKSSNVMLDSNFNAKLGDFGLARLVDHGKDSKTTVLAGTRGYMAPEYLRTGKASKEFDVYSFGVVALEIACGRKPIDFKVPESQMILVEWVWDLYGSNRLIEAAVDPKICLNFVQEEIECLMIVGLWCAHPDHNLRPSIRQAINVLNFEAPLPILPAKMPVATYSAPISN
ncbi:hypothetical protein ACSBR1_022476 [Camellia fascicularis]